MVSTVMGTKVSASNGINRYPSDRRFFSTSRDEPKHQEKNPFHSQRSFCMTGPVLQYALQTRYHLTRQRSKHSLGIILDRAQ